MSVSTPLILGAWFALVPAVVAAALMVVRTALEDGTLQDELDSYKDYARRVRHHLLPTIW